MLIYPSGFIMVEDENNNGINTNKCPEWKQRQSKYADDKGHQKSPVFLVNKSNSRNKPGNCHDQGKCNNDISC